MTEIVILAAIVYACILVIHQIVAFWKNNTCNHGIYKGYNIGRDGKRKCPQCQLVYEERIRALEAQRLEEQKKQVEMQRKREYALQYDKLLSEAISNKNHAVVSSMESILEMTPNDFEDFSASLLSRMGYTDITQTPYSNDGGKDIICRKNGQELYVECKRYAETRSVGRPLIQKLAGAMMADHISHGLFITSGYFTQEAIAEAQRLSIDLIDGYQLGDILQSFDNDSTYNLVCKECGEKVTFTYYNRSDKTCPNGHIVHGIDYSEPIDPRLRKIRAMTSRYAKKGIYIDYFAL